jgi:capsule polysaccharide export protein KpsE/RkpR
VLLLDQRLADFKEKHRNDLPELAQLNLQTMERTELELKDAQTKLDALDSERVLLEAQLAQINPTTQVFSDTGQRVMGPEDRLKSLKSQLAGYKARYAPGHPDIVSTEREVQGLEKEVRSDDDSGDRLRQLSEARAQLARAREKYSAEHPDVMRLQRSVESLEAAVVTEEATGKRRTSAPHADNPVYIQVKGQLDALSVDRDSAVKRHDDLRNKLEDYERRMARSPEVERKYREMARDLESAQLQYQEILAKQTEAHVSENLETERKGEKFTMIEPPQVPEEPISPNRALIVFLGLFLSVALGVGAAAVHESFDASVRGAGDIRQLLQVPALASIPLIVTREDRARRQRLRRFSWVGAVGVLMLVAVTVHLWVRPLDVVWLSVLRRFGV